MPTYLISFLATLGGIAFAFGLGKLLGRHQRAAASEFSGQALSLIGGVLLSSFILLTGFQVAGSWSALSTARSRTYDEARALTDVYWASGGLADTDRTKVRTLLMRYTDEVVSTEFPALAKGRTSPAAWRALDDVRNAVNTAATPRSDQQVAKATAQSNLATVYQTRADRAAEVNASMPLITWLALLVAGGFLIAFPAILGLVDHPRNLVGLCFVGAAVAFAICLTAQLNHAFQQPFAVRPTAFTFAEARFHQMD
ncbi:DUF4239 domain-containing protein [Streptantibioticus ferralitis]|uniref:DUF4239 domain-containing protein n=1 Tax=Streptantibioticus ferralitis TaxID=236510 RepID=A0ABT5Z9G1_9ACTN|nr:DUF4239 domain-containing protein [Streptantibioticus ferralitis]MDF2260449.1 DUF4239 domain-containing protein [Streptantibioticus ferralitis]